MVATVIKMFRLAFMTSFNFFKLIQVLKKINVFYLGFKWRFDYALFKKGIRFLIYGAVI